MNRPRIIWLILLLAALCVYWQPAPQTAFTARIKVENDGAIMSGRNGAPAATAYGYDPYFIHENYTPNVVIPKRKTGAETK